MIFLLALWIGVFMHQGNPHALVSVKICKTQKWADIFSDQAMTIRLPNPFVGDTDGSYHFYTPERCVDIREWEPKK